MKNPLINYQNSVSSNAIDGEKPLSEILDLIKYGSTLTNTLIDKARTCGKGTTEYDEIKKKHLPAFLFNFKFNKKLANDNITESTGLLYLDIDNIESEFTLSILQEEAKHIPYVMACWKSLSETGLSLLISVKGMTKANYYLFKAHFMYWYKYDADTNSGLNLDENAWKPTQKTVLSRDGEIYINEQCCDLTYNEVLCSSFYSMPKRSKEKVQFSLYNKYKYKIGDQTAPFQNVGVIKCYSDKNFYSLTDKQKYADKNAPYTVYPLGVAVNKIFLNRKSPIKEGNRAKMLFIKACVFIRMYGEDYSEILRFLKMVRANYCENSASITDDELKKIAKKSLANYKSAKIKMDKAKIIFPIDSPLSVKEKQSISAREIGNIRTETMIDFLTNIYKPGMKQKELIALSGKSERTVKAYWNKDADGNIYFARPIRKPRKRMKENKNRSG
jgi:hypothetical protein